MSVQKSILRNIARVNMRRAGLTKINKKHTFTSERKETKRSKAFLFTTQSIFSRNWRKFCTSAATAWAMREEKKNRRKPIDRKGGVAMKKAT